MWGGESAWLVVFVNAILPKDWHSVAGKVFLTTIEAVTEFAKKNRLLPKDLLVRGMEAGYGKVKDLFAHEHPHTKEKIETVEAVAKAEATKTETVLEARQLDRDFRGGDKARRDAAHADLAETEAVIAELKLLKELQSAGVADFLKRPEGRRMLLKRLDAAGVVLYWNGENNDLRILPMPQTSGSLLNFPADSETESEDTP